MERSSFPSRRSPLFPSPPAPSSRPSAISVSTCPTAASPLPSQVRPVAPGSPPPSGTRGPHDYYIRGKKEGYGAGEKTKVRRSTSRSSGPPHASLSRTLSLSLSLSLSLGITRLLMDAFRRAKLYDIFALFFTYLLYGHPTSHSRRYDRYRVT